MEKFVIAGPSDDGIRLYWSNENGWVDRYSATTFDDESVNDPIGATDRVFEGEPICDLCGFPPECGREFCTVCAGNWNGETGNHFGCEATEEYNGN